MKSSLKYPLFGEVHVDECYIGGEESLKQGRSKGKKKLVVVALEKLPYEGVGRAYAQIITDASNVSFRPFFDEHRGRQWLSTLLIILWMVILISWRIIIRIIIVCIILSLKVFVVLTRRIRCFV